MFLHSGASLHGHEYSSRPSSLQSPAHLRGPLLRSAFSPPKQRAPARLAPDGTPAPELRQRPASDYIPRDPSPVVRFREPQDDDPPPTPLTHDESISESELSDVTLSIDGAVSLARASSSARCRRPRRAPRKSTTYCLGYPAPRIIGKTKVVQKVFLPRLLLQLQKVSAEGRSKPVLEVYPASRIAGPVVAPRLSKRFPGIFGVKRHLAYDDIVLVKRDDGDASSEATESENEENLERRNLLAVYSPLRHSEEAEIVLDDGSVWVARPLANGSYDFVHTDAEGHTTTARWARRHTTVATPTSLSTDTSSSSASAQARYTFSIINPLTRRHPVMATLTPSTLEVQETYASVSSSHARHPPITRVNRSQSVTSSPAFARTAPYSPSKLSSCDSTSDAGENDSAICIPSSPDHESSKRTVHQIDDATKLLIAVTALWVCLRPGWSQSHNPSTTTSSTSHETTTSPPPPPPSTTTTTCHRNRSRRNTWNTRSSTSDTPRPLEFSPTLTGEAPRSLGKRYSMPAQVRPPEQHNTHKPAPPTPAISRTSTPTSMISTSTLVDATAKAPPRRATSTGAAFMQRRLQASSPSPSVVGGGGGERDAVVEAEFSRRGHAPPPAMAAPLVDNHRMVRTEEGDVGMTRQVDGLRDKRASLRRGVEGGGEGLGGVGGGGGSGGAGGVKKGGVRSRLARWIHKLGTSSSSSSSR